MLTFLVVLAVVCSIPLLFFVVGVLHKSYKENRERAEEDAQRERTEREKREKEIWERLREEVIDTFHIWLENIHERHVQNEIVRRMNLLAKQVAEACVSQDKANSGEVESYHLGQKTYLLKTQWSKARKLALQICPELADRMPHFSEFEPLKSYREEHLQEKAKKKSAA